MKIRIPTELEDAVIACLVLSPDVLVELDWLETAHFAQSPAIYALQAIRNLEAAKATIDFVTVLSAMQKLGEGAAARAEEYLGDCVRKVPDPSRVHEYAQQLRDEAIARKVRLELERVANSPVASGLELLSMALASITRLDIGGPDQTPTISDVVKRRLRQLEQIAQDRASGARTMTGYPTGIASLDELLGGFQSKIATIIAARPAMGKSSLGLACADACTAANFGVHLFSLEDTEESYGDRTMSRLSQVPAESLRNVSLSRVEMRDVTNVLPKLAGRRWLVDSRAGITADEVVRSVRKHRRANDTRVVIVDYIQLLKPARSQQPKSRHEVLTEAITTLADAAKADDLAYVVMSQLNRDVEKRHDKRPQLSDLRESGSLEERSKCVLGVYRGHVYSSTPVRGIDYHEDEQAPNAYEFARQVQLLVLKNNNGRTGEVRATFFGPTTRME